jgi:hypothetical protein
VYEKERERKRERERLKKREIQNFHPHFKKLKVSRGYKV